MRRRRYLSGRSGYSRRRYERRRFAARIFPFALFVFALAAAVLFSLHVLGQRRSYPLKDRRLGMPEEASAFPFTAEELCVLTPEEGAALGDPAMIDAEAGLMINDTAHVPGYSKAAYARLYPASMTKVMTALLLLESGSLDEEVTVTDAAVITEPGATLAGIKPGDRISLRHLLYGLLLPSGNDAANAIAVHISGSVEAFVEKMNARAVELGAVGTHFVNPSGLSDDQHYTTAYDMYLIFHEALKHEEFREAISSASHYARWVNGAGQKVELVWKNSNRFLTGEAAAPEGITVAGGKTGTTKAAGYCLVLSATDASGDQLITVAMKSGSRDNLYANTTKLLSENTE